MSNEFEAVADWELLAHVSQAYRSLSDAFMDQIALHRAQATVLCHLYVQNGLTQSEIAERLGVQGATVTQMLQRMEEVDLVSRQRDSEDNRLVRVYLTDKGRERERSLTEQFLKLQEHIFAGFDEQERRVLRQLLARLHQNMLTKHE